MISDDSTGPYSDGEPTFEQALGNLDETVAGTTGPGCALTERRPCVVTGGEHFLEEAGGFICAAVPLFAPDGELAGVLNASRRHDGRALGVLEPLALAAREVENHMVANLAGDLRLAIHYRAELTDSPVRGLIHFDRDGCLLGANPVARQLLDLTRLEAEGRPVTLERLWGKVAPFVATNQGKRIVRNGKSPDFEEVSAWIRWAGAARTLNAA